MVENDLQRRLRIDIVMLLWAIDRVPTEMTTFDSSRKNGFFPLAFERNFGHLKSPFGQCSPGTDSTRNCQYSSSETGCNWLMKRKRYWTLQRYAGTRCFEDAPFGQTETQTINRKPTKSKYSLIDDEGKVSMEINGDAKLFSV